MKNATVAGLFAGSTGQTLSDVAAGEVNCGIILKLDGSFNVFAKGVEVAEISGDPATMSAEQRAKLEMMEKISAIALALSNQQIMAVLLDLGNQVEVLKPEQPR